MRFLRSHFFAFTFTRCFLGSLRVQQPAFFRQFFFLTAQQFSMATGFFFAANQFGIFSSGLCLQCSRCVHPNFFGLVNFVFATDKSTLFTDFNLDGAGLAGGIGLLDLRGRFFHQRDLFTICRNSAMTGMEIAEQLLLVGLRQGIAGLRFDNAGAGQLLDQGSG